MIVKVILAIFMWASAQHNVNGAAVVSLSVPNSSEFGLAAAVGSSVAHITVCTTVVKHAPGVQHAAVYLCYPEGCAAASDVQCQCNARGSLSKLAG